MYFLDAGDLPILLFCHLLPFPKTSFSKGTHKNFICTGTHDKSNNLIGASVQFSSVQLLSHVQFFVTPWSAVHKTSLSINNSWNLLKLMSIESMMLSNHLILCHPLFLLQSFPASRSFQMSQLFASGGQHIGVSALTSVFPMNIQDLFPLGLTDCISLQSKGFSRVFSNTIVQKHNSKAL